MNGIAHRLVGAVQVACNGGRRLPLGTGEEDRAAAYRKGGRRPEPGLQGSPLVRRERAHKSGCLHTQEYTTCPKGSIGSALGALLDAVWVSGRRNGKPFWRTGKPFWQSTRRFCF